MALNISTQQTDLDLPVQGLRFEANNTVSLNSAEGWFSLKVASSRGPLISDYVTHEPTFHYGTYGIHVGQDDRLTFMGGDGQTIIGHFIDCREGSPTAGAHVEVVFDASPHRKIVIPRGVAHTFDNLERVVTRDEPVWYSDDENPAWNVDNDLISFSRSTPPAEAPRVEVNRFLLSPEAHQLMSRLSQRLLSTPRAYLNRFEVKLGAARRYITLEPKLWLDQEGEISGHLQRRFSIEGVRFQKNRYALTGKRSWTIVPSTESCVSDVLLLADTGRSDVLFCHARTQKIYTFLSAEGADLSVTLFDARAGSRSEGRRERVEFKADPRVSMVIPHGVAYRISTPVPILVRCEHVVFVDEAEPRADIPMFNQDLIHEAGSALRGGFRISVPAIQLPPAVVYQFARMESMGAPAH